MRYPLASAALFALLAACGGEGFDAGEYDVTGRWTGTALADTARYDFDLELTQEEEDISGSGQVRVRGQSIPVTVRGDFGFPNVDLTLSAPGFVPLAFDAVFRPDTVSRPPQSPTVVIDENRNFITGTLASSSLNGVRLTIERQ